MSTVTTRGGTTPCDNLQKVVVVSWREPGGLVKGFPGNTIISNDVDDYESGSRIWVWCIVSPSPYRPPKKTKEESSAETSFLALSDFPLPGMSLTLLVFSGVTHLEATTVCHTSSPSSPVRMCLSQLATILPGSTWYIPPSYPSKKSTTSPSNQSKMLSHLHTTQQRPQKSLVTAAPSDLVTRWRPFHFGQKKGLFFMGRTLSFRTSTSKKCKKLYEGSMNHQLRSLVILHQKTLPNKNWKSPHWTIHHLISNLI